jgi:hypothetical protein
MTRQLQSLSDAVGNAKTVLDALPEPIKRNLFQAAGALITGLADVPASYLEMKAAEFKVKKAGHEKIMLAAAENAAKIAGHSSELGNRAMEYFVNSLVREQSNREAVFREAVQAAKSLPPPDPLYFTTAEPSTFGGKRVVFTQCAVPVPPGPFNVGPLATDEIWTLSSAAMQLAPLLAHSFDIQYARKLRDGLRRIGVALTFPDFDINAATLPA